MTEGRSQIGHGVWVGRAALLGGLIYMVQRVTFQLHESLPLCPDSLFTCFFFFLKTLILQMAFCILQCCSQCLHPIS